MVFLQRIHWNHWRRRRRELEQHLERSPSDCQAWLRLAEVHRALVDPPKAIECYRTAASLMVDAHALNRAAATLRMALQLAPRSGSLHDELRALERQLALRRPRPAPPPLPSLAEAPPGPTLKVEEAPSPYVDLDPLAIDEAPTLRGQPALRLRHRADAVEEGAPKPGLVAAGALLPAPA